MKKILTEFGMTKLNGDEAFYMKHDDDNLEGMLLMHVDDFLVSGTAEFVNDLTEMLKKNLTVSQVEDDQFRYCGVDIRTEGDSFVMSMEDYVASLEVEKIREAKKNEKLTKIENQKTFIDQLLDIAKPAG